MEKLKIMVADNNPILLQQLAESVCNDSQMELVGASDNGKEAYQIIEREKPNVVVFDLLLPYYDGLALLDKLKEQKENEKQTKFIMTTPLTNDVIVSESYKRGADYIIVKPYDVEMISSKIKKVCKIMDRKKEPYGIYHSLDVTISNKLNQIGVPASLKGYRYMITAIKEVINDESMLEGVTKILYPGIAKKHNSTPQRVEKAIRHAIEVTWKQSDDENLKSKFQYSVRQGKARPTNTEFIAVVSQNIKLSA